MKYTILTNTLFLHNTLFLISGTERSDELPSITDVDKIVVSNDKATYVLLGGMVKDHELPIRLFVGDAPPKKMKLVSSIELTPTDNEVYFGDIRKESYIIVGTNQLSVKMEVYVDSKEKATLVYVYVIAEFQSLKINNGVYPVDESLIEEINNIGKREGCHICGTKDAIEYLPHLLPPFELNDSNERRWYPICPSDYRKYEQEIARITESLI